MTYHTGRKNLPLYTVFWLINLLIWHVDDSHAVLFPVITEARITACDDWDGAGPPCSVSVKYAGHVSMLEIGQPGTPPLGGFPLLALGVHCQSGWAGVYPFSSCYWESTGHAPTMTGCRLEADGWGGWTIERPASCRFSQTWGPHTGAGPGGECVVFGQKISLDTAQTPYGLLDATTVANSGSRFCIKPTPPAVRCEVNLSPTIDHGELPPDGADTATVKGTMDCGSTPTVTIVGANEVELAPGVTTRIHAVATSMNEITVSSEMMINGATPGVYHANVIIVVSPQ